ncbi:MAG: ABC transporter substrate-binding protein [Alphaproteobacteria bacterium]|nr:ABC transporter substrate-binding protein [Alphaproteobacteria bacterium]
MSSSSSLVISRREVLAGFGAVCAAGFLPSLGAKAAPLAEPLTIWGIPASPSAVFSRAVASGALDTVAPGASFDIWKSTDQMRAGVATGDFQLFASSTYAAANFYNRGAGTRMVNVVTWGVLYIMARDESITSIADLAGKRILNSNKNEAPDLIFRLVLKWAGLDPDKDVSIDYVGSPNEAVPLFLSGRGDVAVMHEPAATAALIAAKQQGLSLFRVLDVTELYGQYTGRGPKIPQVGLAVSEDFLDAHDDVVRAVHEACVEAGQWVLANAEAAGALAAKTLPLPAPVIAQSLPFVHLDVRTAKDSRADIEAYFDHLIGLDPGIVGGKLPDSGFYWG